MQTLHKPLTMADEELHDLDNDLSDLSEVWIVCTRVFFSPEFLDFL